MIKHSLGRSLQFEDRMCVRVEEGEYSGSVFSIESIEMENDEQDVVCKFDVELFVVSGKPSEYRGQEKFKQEAVHPIILGFIEDALRQYQKTQEIPKADAL